MFGQLKASLGIGAAKVDTILNSISYVQGDTLQGSVNIYGGDVDQQVDAINLKLCTEVKVESEDGTSYQHFTAIDPKDRDFVEIKPLPAVAKLITGVEDSGFTMVKADVEKGYLKGSNFSSKSGCYQEIEFRNNGLINKKEIELSFILDADVIHCLAEVDRSLSFRGDQYISFSLNRNATDAEIRSALSRILSV